MDVITSTEFRKTYAKLKKPTIVSVNGHQIGTWLPWERRSPASYMRHYIPVDAINESDSAQTTQAKRDELLRKINRSK